MRLLLALLAVCLLTGCATTVAGTAEPAPGQVSTPAATSTAASPTAANANCKPAADLIGCVMAAPAGTAPYDGLGIGQSGPVTLDAYVKALYKSGDVAQVTKEYQDEGLVSIAHRGWKVGELNCDIVLMRFDSTSGATRDAQGTKTYNDGDASLAKVDLTGVPATVRAYHDVKPDQNGYVYGEVVDSYGVIAMDVLSLNKDTFDAGTMSKWVKQQISLIQ